MKKVNYINIGKHSLYFDIDACETLEKYIERIKELYRDNGEDLKAAEVEERIADMCHSAVGDNGIVSNEKIGEILDAIGLPIEKTEVEDQEGKEADNTTADKESDEENAPWRIAKSMGNKVFRDGNDSILGGVLSGLAKYYGVSTVMLRILAVLLCFMPYVPVILTYIILWLTFPQASSIIDRTRMRRVNAKDSEQDIDTAWKNNYNIAINELHTLPNNGGCLGAGVRVLFFIFLAVILIPIAIVAFFALFAMLALGEISFQLIDFAPFIASSCIIAIIGIPLFALIHWILKRRRQCKPMHTAIKTTFIIAWIAVLVFTAITIVNKNLLSTTGNPVGNEMSIIKQNIMNIMQGAASSIDKQVTWYTGSYYAMYPIESESNTINAVLWDKNEDLLKEYDFPYIIEARTTGDGKHELFFFDGMERTPHDYSGKFCLKLNEGEYYKSFIDLYLDKKNGILYIATDNNYFAGHGSCETEVVNMHGDKFIYAHDTSTLPAKSADNKLLKLRVQYRSSKEILLYVDVNEEGEALSTRCHSQYYSKKG